jgi:hypothetical protein
MFSLGTIIVVSAFVFHIPEFVRILRVKREREFALIDRFLHYNNL